MPKKKKTDSTTEEGPVPQKKTKMSKTQGKNTSKKEKLPKERKDQSASGAGVKCDLKLKTFLKDDSWLAVLGEEFEKEYFTKIENVLDGLKKKKVTVYPPLDLIFNAFTLTPFNEVRSTSYETVFINYFVYLMELRCSQVCAEYENLICASWFDHWTYSSILQCL